MYKRQADTHFWFSLSYLCLGFTSLIFLLNTSLGFYTTSSLILHFSTSWCTFPFAVFFITLLLQDTDIVCYHLSLHYFKAPIKTPSPFLFSWSRFSLTFHTVHGDIQIKCKLVADIFVNQGISLDISRLLSRVLY